MSTSTYQAGVTKLLTRREVIENLVTLARQSESLWISCLRAGGQSPSTEYAYWGASAKAAYAELGAYKRAIHVALTGDTQGFPFDFAVSQLISGTDTVAQVLDRAA